MYSSDFDDLQIDLQSLLRDFESPDGLVRQRSRRILVNIGRPVVPKLIEVLYHPNQEVRWEAAKALAVIADPRAAKDLVKLLEDESISVRWAATEALVAIGRPSLVPLLTALTTHFNSVWLREGAHHVLHELHNKKQLTNEEIKVFKALEHVAPEMEVPWAAEKALENNTIYNT